MQLPDQKLSPHFWLSEFTHSQVATRRRIRNEPLTVELDNLRRLALVLEDVRAALRHMPVLISSGFRSRALNTAVGGARNSAHVDGRAADFTAPAFGTPRDICQRLIDRGVVFDQLIYEQTWVHIGIAAEQAAPRRELLSAVFHADQPTTYVKGLL